MNRNSSQGASELTFHIPEGIDPDIFKGNGERPARLAYVAHLLTTMKPNVNNFILLNKQRLQKIISFKAESAAFKILMPYIEIDHQYIPNKQSKGYRWTLPYRDQQSIPIVIRCPRFIQHQQKLQSEARKTYTEIEANVEMDMSRITLGINDLKGYIMSIPDKPSVLSQAHRRNHILATGQQIERGDFGLVTTSKNTGRIHCLINRLSSAIRPHLAIDRMPVTELDLASSQPYFLTTIFSSPALIEAVSRGEFYQRVNEAMPTPISMLDPFQYSVFKQSVLAALYARPINGHCYWNDPNNKTAQVLEAMEKAFNGIKSFIASYSATHGDTGLPIALQRAESSVFISSITTELQKSSIPVIPIHDAFLCKRSHADQVKQTMYTQLARYTGIEPVIRMS